MESSFRALPCQIESLRTSKDHMKGEDIIAQWFNWLVRKHIGKELRNTSQPLCIYGDPAYPFFLHIQTPHRNQNLTQAQRA